MHDYRWHFLRQEKKWIWITGLTLLALGALIERRTALRHEPMTDFGVFCIASGAVWSGQNPYSIPDWHGWHYQYPPALAIVFLPLAEPVPLPASYFPPEANRTAANTPWGYEITGNNFYGLHAANEHFFFAVAAWFVLSVLGIFFSAHALACALEGKELRAPPPAESFERRHWWYRRLLPLIICSVSLGTDLSRGQVDILMLVAIASGLYLCTRQKHFRAGMLLAVPAAVKMFPVLLLALPVLRKNWSMVLGSVAGLFFLLAALPVATLGFHRTAELYQRWANVLVKPALGQGTDTSRQAELTGMGSTDNQALLQAIHNWTHPAVWHDEKTGMAAAWERKLVYLAGLVMAAGIIWSAGFRRPGSPQELLVAAGLLLGLVLVISPVVHNFYYLLILPLIAALVDLALKAQLGSNWLLLLAAFTLIDWLARVPGIGPELRMLGVPLLSLMTLLVCSAFLLKRIKATPPENPVASL